MSSVHRSNNPLRAAQPVPSATRTASGVSDARWGASNGVATLTVYAASGTTPTLDVSLEVQRGADPTWITLLTFERQTGPGGQAMNLSLPQGGAYNLTAARYRFTIGGTGASFTFGVSEVF